MIKNKSVDSRQKSDTNTNIFESQKLVVITHHLPSYKSINEKYASYRANHCFASHKNYIIKRLSPNLWIHGHTHTSVDYTIRNNQGFDSRIICNPKGYHNENSSFNPSLVIDI
jgi:Icc-related predicted phosphoesterase